MPSSMPLRGIVRSPRLRSARSVAIAALLCLGIFSLRAAHLDADSLKPASSTPESARAIISPSWQRDRAKYLAERRGLAFGVPRDAYAQAVASTRAMESRTETPSRAQIASGAADPNWNSIGPQPIANELPTFGGFAVGPALASATGRVTAIAVDPTTSGRLFVGSAAGGLWMSTNGGSTFAPIFDAQPTLAIGSIVLNPATRPPTIYVGTGEGDNSGNSYYGLGVFSSTDLGQTWTQNTAGGAFSDVSIGRLAINSSVTPPALFAAVGIGSSSNRAASSLIEDNLFDNGIWRSTDGGMTWSQIPFGSQNSCPSYGGLCPGEDVAVDHASPSHVYASLYNFGVFGSSDGGQTWSALSFPDVANSSIGRASVAALNGTVYVALGASDGMEYAGFFKSTDSGNSFTPEQVPFRTLRTGNIDGATPGNFSQADFDQALTIVPSDTSGATAIFGGVGTYESTDSGADWAFLQISGGSQSDQHALVMEGRPEERGTIDVIDNAAKSPQSVRVSGTTD